MWPMGCRLGTPESHFLLKRRVWKGWKGSFMVEKLGQHDLH